MRVFRLLVFSLVGLGACQKSNENGAPVKTTQETAQTSAQQATSEEARLFMAKVDADLRRLWVASQEAEWAKSTNITDATEAAAAKANEAVMEYIGKAIKEARRFDGVDVDSETARQLYLLKIAVSLPAPDDAAQREELARIAAKMEGIYGKGKVCTGNDKTKCRDLGALEDVLAESHNYKTLLAAWTGWHGIAKELKPLYSRYVELANAGARDIGYANFGELWRSGYDMEPVAFTKEVERLWTQVEPLYDQLHCYVRGELAATYGADKVRPGEPIPAHLLGNMWAQDWANVYSLVEPYKGQPSLDATPQLKSYDPVKMVRLGESFFTSLGLDPLPDTFWQRSMFEKPNDREVVCHASAWDVGFNDDLRIKMCIKRNQEDLITIHHELGHDYYFHSYFTKPMLYQNGANDGFHEAIGDAIALSVTPTYLKDLGLLSKVPTDKKGLINQQMQVALGKVAFLPFGMLIDKWRWQVFAGEVTPANYNAAWWALRRKYQGVAAPIARTEEDFDPGAKYHIPANVPYMRYFLAHILQFQFHRALCEAAGFEGPLYECSIYGNKEAGARLKAMLDMGASKSWPEALAALTGQRMMDASALLEYFAPLEAWLAEKNQGKQCGWQ